MQYYNIMARTPYTCPICGKILKLGGVRNIEFHEKSAFHIAAIKQGKKNVQEPVQEPNVTGIQTTVPEGLNDTNKETREHERERNDDSGEWDGYLC